MNQSMNRAIVRLVAGMVFIFLLWRGGVHAGQWRGYRCDNARSGASTEPLHLQWFVFPDSGAPAGSRIRRLAVNFGASRDKRDLGDTPWTAFPRPFMPGALTVPLFAMNLPTYYRRNADAYTITGTDRPWLYTSGAEGLQQADLEVRYDEAAARELVRRFADRNLTICPSETFLSAGHFNGMLDDIRITHAALSPETIQWLFESGRQTGELAAPARHASADGGGRQPAESTAAERERYQ